MAEAKRTPFAKVMTPLGIAKFPVLNTPDTKFNPEGDFKCGVILTAEEGAPLMARLTAAAQKMFDATKAELTEKVATEKGEKKAKAKKALDELKLGDLPVKPVYDEEGNETGDLAFNFKMKATRKDAKTGAVKHMRPMLFDSKGEEFPNTLAIWGGSQVKVAGSINPFYIPGTNTVGVGLRLSAVQIITLNTSGGGNASSFGFGKEDGYDVDKSDGATEGFADESAPASSECDDF